VHSAPFIFIFAIGEMTSHIGIAFKAGGAFPFLPLPVDELPNQVVPLDTLWGSFVYLLRDQLLEAPTTSAKFALLEQALLARLICPEPIHPAVAVAVARLPHFTAPQPVAALADQVGLSMRRFKQIFGAQVGLSPKRFHRVQRFQQVLKQIHGQSMVNWADVACQHGYFDQTHLIHEFQEMASVCPNVYLTYASHHMNYLPIDATCV
jgi:AraC-like DNA-binding protein